MGDEPKPSYYDQLAANDIIEMMKPLLERAGYQCRWGDGKLVTAKSIGWDTPWVHTKHSMDLDCHTWHQIMFNVVFQKLGKKFVPSPCQQCWKVVARPQTLLGLFALEQLQRQLDRPSKCGIEIRETVCGLYGGYWYNHSQAEGLECYTVVRKAIDDDPYLGPDAPVILKRACTEFEHGVGPSDKWEVSDEQKHIEALINNYVVCDSNMQAQPEHVAAHVRKRWIQFAYAAGDLTYKKFTGGRSLYPGYVTYHHLADKAEGESKGDGAGQPPAPDAQPSLTQE